MLTITFSEEIDATLATQVDPAKIHIRSPGNYTHGVTLTAGRLGTTADASTISFALTSSHLAAVAGLATPELTIEPGAVQDTAGNPIDGTLTSPPPDSSTPSQSWMRKTFQKGVAFSNDGAKMFVVGTNTDSVHEYALTATFDVSTATHTANVTVSTQADRPEGVAFSNDGTEMFIAYDVAGPAGGRARIRAVHAV